MKPTRPSVRHFLKRRGSALLTVVIFSGVMFILTGSLLQYTVTERRSNERNRLILRSRNMAENVAIYASEQLTTKLRRLRSPSPIKFTKGANQIYLPSDDILKTENSGTDDVAVFAGLTSNTGLKFIDPKLYPNDPNKGLQIDTATVKIIAKSTMRNSSIGEVTTYVEQDLAVDLTPLFQFGVFYNMDMEFGPGPNMTITGPVHTNGNLIARIQTKQSATLTFADRVSAVGGFYANTAYKGSTWMNDGVEDKGPGGTGSNSKLRFTKPDGTEVDIYDSSKKIWRDHFFLSDSGTKASTPPTATNLDKFESFANTNLGGNLRTSEHQVPELKLPAVGSYNEVSAPTAGRELIEEPYATDVPVGTKGDTAELALTKISRNAGLYIIVNPDDEPRWGKYPDGTRVLMKSHSYRCFLTYVDSDLKRQKTEVVLPGQPSYGQGSGADGVMNTVDDEMYQNDLPNRYTDMTAFGINQVLRLPASGRAVDQPIAAHVAAGAKTGYAIKAIAADYTTIPDHVFYDIRRATNNTGNPWKRATNPYLLRPIAKIDFDMARFRLAVERTLESKTKSSAIFYPGLDLAAAEWNNSVLNAAAKTANNKQYNLGVNYAALTDFSGFPVNTPATALYYADPFRIYKAPVGKSDLITVPAPNISQALVVSDFVDISNPSPWSDGISIYIHSVEAENHTKIETGSPERIDSGVRLWNGRGPVISLDKLNYSGRTGFTLATNDAVYVVGHFNADGSVNIDSSDKSATGGYSAQWPDSGNERLCAVMGDAITILSQPVFSTSGGVYYQTSGWADSFSAHRPYVGAYKTDWAKLNPAPDNTVDGIDAKIRAASRPQYSDIVAHPGPAAAPEQQGKFSPTATEISSCLLTGIVRTTSGQTSGGVHNFPRLLENWSGTALAIRGSMVALFESQVGIEPWSIRAYTGAGRHWGLHQALRDADHDVPLEPIVIGAHRLRYLELTSTQYEKIAKEISVLKE